MGRVGPACRRFVRYYRNPVFRVFFHALPENRLVRDRHTRLAAAAILSRSVRRSRLPDLLLCSSGLLARAQVGIAASAPAAKTQVPWGTTAVPAVVVDPPGDRRRGLVSEAGIYLLPAEVLLSLGPAGQPPEVSRPAGGSHDGRSRRS